jgi:hypothetical protein
VRNAKKNLLASVAGLAFSMLTQPLQAAPASDATSLRTTAGEAAAVEQAHYYRRHYRYYRYYRAPYFYRRHHYRYWRRW